MPRKVNISPDDLLYGARSGIQKGIRRGNLDLVKTCFDILWNDKQQRNWLKWRLTVLVFEECWPMLGELHEFYESKPTEEAQYRKFIYQLALATKSKDAPIQMLINAPSENFTPEQWNHYELRNVKILHDKIENDDPTTVVDSLFEECVISSPRGKITDYERNAIRLVRKRVGMGGMLGDRMSCLSVMMLISFRGLNPQFTKADIKAGAKRWYKRIRRKRQPKTVTLPWYCFDMHTQAGKIGGRIFEKHKMGKYPGLEPSNFYMIWFFCASGVMEKSLIRWKTHGFESATQFDPYDTVWWIPLMKHHLTYGTNDARATKSLWDKSMEEDIRGGVRWILQKRSEK